MNFLFPAKLRYYASDNSDAILSKVSSTTSINTTQCQHELLCIFDNIVNVEPCCYWNKSVFEKVKTGLQNLVSQFPDLFINDEMFELFLSGYNAYIGSEQNGRRPVVIIQNNVGNKYSPTVIVASITSKIGAKAKLPTHYYIGTECGLELPSVVLLEQLRTIDKRRIDGYIGQLSQKHIDGINHALAISLDLVNKLNDALIMSLCPVCEQHFRNTGSYYVYRLDSEQQVKDTCTYCNKRMGFDCVIIRKKK